MRKDITINVQEPVDTSRLDSNFVYPFYWDEDTEAWTVFPSAIQTYEDFKPF